MLLAADEMSYPHVDRMRCGFDVRWLLQACHLLLRVLGRGPHAVCKLVQAEYLDGLMSVARKGVPFVVVRSVLRAVCIRSFVLETLCGFGAAHMAPASFFRCTLLRHTLTYDTGFSIERQLR